MLTIFGDARLAIARLIHDQHIGLRFDDRPQAIPHDRVVIHTEDTNCICVCHCPTIAIVTAGAKAFNLEFPAGTQQTGYPR